MTEKNRKKFFEINLAQTKCLAVFSIFAIIGFGPISPGCLIGMSIVLMRPMWFWNLIGDLYDNPQPYQLSFSTESKQTRKKVFLCLLCLFIIDIAPVPVTPVVAFCIILSRPLWFYQLVAKIYGQHD
ncbi:MAG: hypothetical protein PHN45_12575 [Methylococcales bacterium]|nr:hypothetical protein [Methylococcales bacterium]MDD5755568.1 hypothetical protein [Methylococcales bacterium]